MRILILSYHFAPQNTIAAIRTTKIAKYLIRLGYNVDILCGPKLNIDPILEKDLNEIKNVFRINGLKIYEESTKKYYNRDNKDNLSDKNKIKKYIINIFNKILPNQLSVYLALANSVIWQFKAKLFINNKFDYDIIFSSFGPIGNFILGYKLKKNRKVIWIADYRDSIIQENFKTYVKRFFYYYQYKALKNADISFCISMGLMDELKKLDPKINIHLITNGYDPEDTNFLIKNQHNNDEFVLSYCGSIYSGKRNFEPLFSIISELILEKKLNRKKVKILFVGSEFSIIKKISEKYNLDDVIYDIGFVSRDVALNISYNSDVVLLSSWNTKKSKGIITGKIFELILTKNPILAFIGGNIINSELKNIIYNINGGVVLEENDKESYKLMKDSIYSLYIKKIEGNKYLQKYNIDNTYRYNYKNITDQIDKIIRDYSNNK